MKIGEEGMTRRTGVRYFATIGSEVREVVLGSDCLSVDGEPSVGDITSLPGSDRQHLRLDGRSLALFARRQDGAWLIELEGRSFTVEVEDERTRRIRDLASHVAPVDIRRDLRAPMPGLIVRIDVVVGQTVVEGDSLVVMEAMKMENELRADGPARVTSIEIEPGQAVDRDMVLLRLEKG